ncbi:uncharacterized protein LOC123260165 isoform X1 [Cotesia glomerata]|uniref:uncharacterized protein LOC123260165 isoform X1 n=1 Tax=Cotesia glomerata TaxID=32391 RepID=UPI001D02B503|nr:uncharacterized protein LOC123260165 isoform X1 [Cotesia glomerata]
MGAKIPQFLDTAADHIFGQNVLLKSTITGKPSNRSKNIQVEKPEQLDAHLMQRMRDEPNYVNDSTIAELVEVVFESSDEETTENINVQNWETQHDSTDIKETINGLKNLIMFKSANLSVWQVFTAVMAIIVGFNLSDEVHQALLELIKFVSGPEFKYLDTSKYLMNKLFNPLSSAAEYVFHCTKCNASLTKPIPISKNIQREVKCDKCNAKYKTSKKEGNFFVTLDMQSQLQHFLSNEFIQQEIENNVKNRPNFTNGSISDVYDSERYINDEFIWTKNDENNTVLTLNVNLDGAPLFKSGKNSFWPIQCIINEIPQSSAINLCFWLVYGTLRLSQKLIS